MGKSIAYRQMQIQAFSILSLFFIFSYFSHSDFFGKKNNNPLMMFKNCPSYYKTPFLDYINTVRNFLLLKLCVICYIFFSVKSN